MCDVPFTKEATMYLLLFCFVLPVLVNGFCHINIAIVLARSMKAESQLSDMLVLIEYLNNILLCKLKIYLKYQYL